MLEHAAREEQSHEITTVREIESENGKKEEREQ
jgi:hypothetical protein